MIELALSERPAQTRDWRNALKRGFLGRCPQCGEGAFFTAFLKVTPACPACGEDFSHQRADDAPP